MTMATTRRAILRGGLATAGLGMVGIPEWALPALAQGERVIQFTDYPANYVTSRNETSRSLDLRKIDGMFTPRDQFFTTQHMGHPEIDGAAFRLKVTGLVEKPKSYSLDQLKALGSTEVPAGFECSGNSPRGMQGLSSCGKFTGVPLRKVLSEAGVKGEAREIVFFGADHREEEVDFRGTKYKVDQQFGRSLTREEATAPEPFIAWNMNGEPLTKAQGFPLRLIVPGWYGVANVKWLSQIHAQEDVYLGNYQARWYRTLKGDMVDGEMKWTETAISRMHLKSVIARVTSESGQIKVLGFVLNDGTPIKSVEVKVDGGAWQPATLDPSNTKYSWKLFTYAWKGATSGEHTLVSRVTDTKGRVQPEAAELANKKSFLEDNSQMIRKVTIT